MQRLHRDYRIYRSIPNKPDIGRVGFDTSPRPSHVYPSAMSGEVIVVNVYTGNSLTVLIPQELHQPACAAAEIYYPVCYTQFPADSIIQTRFNPVVIVVQRPQISRSHSNARFISLSLHQTLRSIQTRRSSAIRLAAANRNRPVAD